MRTIVEGWGRESHVFLCDFSGRGDSRDAVQRRDAEDAERSAEKTFLEDTGVRFGVRERQSGGWCRRWDLNPHAQ
jgi:hypothetical protein